MNYIKNFKSKVSYNFHRAFTSDTNTLQAGSSSSTGNRKVATNNSLTNNNSAQTHTKSHNNKPHSPTLGKRIIDEFKSSKAQKVTGLFYTVKQVLNKNLLNKKNNTSKQLPDNNQAKKIEHVSSNNDVNARHGIENHVPLFGSTSNVASLFHDTPINDKFSQDMYYSHPDLSINFQNYSQLEDSKMSTSYVVLNPSEKHTSFKSSTWPPPSKKSLISCLAGSHDYFFDASKMDTLSDNYQETDNSLNTKDPNKQPPVSEVPTKVQDEVKDEALDEVKNKMKNETPDEVKSEMQDKVQDQNKGSLAIDNNDESSKNSLEELPKDDISSETTFKKVNTENLFKKDKKNVNTKSWLNSFCCRITSMATCFNQFFSSIIDKIKTFFGSGTKSSSDPDQSITTDS